MSVTVGSICTGYGGLDMAVEEFTGGKLAWVSDVDPGACRIIEQRFPGVTNIGDITSVNWSEVTPVDVICGGTPCQDLSGAGRRAGMKEGTRSNLWVAMREAIETIRPSLVVWENVRGALSASAESASDDDFDSDVESGAGRVGETHTGPVLRAFGRVLGDLTEIGYDAEWAVVPAHAVGAPHRRERVFLVARPRRAAAAPHATIK